MNWPTIYKITFGRTVNEEEVGSWDELFRRDFPGIRGEEIVAAIEEIGERTRKAGQKGTPATYPQIKSAIIRLRYRKRGANGPGDDSFLTAMRAAMRGARTHEERWDVMCDPVGMGVAVERRTTIDECKILVRWAGTVWPEWRDEAAAVKRRIAEMMRKKQEQSREEPRISAKAEQKEEVVA